MSGLPPAGPGDRPAGRDRGPGAPATRSPGAPALRLTVQPPSDRGTDLHLEVDPPACGPVTVRVSCARSGQEATTRLACPAPSPEPVATPTAPSPAPAATGPDAAPGPPVPGADPDDPGDPRTPTPPGAAARPAPTAARVRAWARSQGMSVADVGRIPLEIVAEYLAAADRTEDQGPR